MNYYQTPPIDFTDKLLDRSFLVFFAVITLYFLFFHLWPWIKDYAEKLRNDRKEERAEFLRQRGEQTRDFLAQLDKRDLIQREMTDRMREIADTLRSNTRERGGR